jgi:hypothetical protein
LFGLIDHGTLQGSLEESVAALTVVKAKEVLNFDGRPAFDFDKLSTPVLFWLPGS